MALFQDPFELIRVLTVSGLQFSARLKYSFSWFHFPVLCLLLRMAALLLLDEISGYVLLDD